MRNIRYNFNTQKTYNYSNYYNDNNNYSNNNYYPHNYPHNSKSFSNDEDLYKIKKCKEEMLYYIDKYINTPNINYKKLPSNFFILDHKEYKELEKFKKSIKKI